jgi:predicted transcriptional regulator
MENELTTIQIKKEVSKKLKALAETYKRSKSSHVEWLIEQDYEKWAAVKLMGAKASKETKSKNNQAATQA